MAKKKKVYGVAKGRKTGLFYEWFGPEGAEIQINGFEGAIFKGFKSQEEAQAWLDSSPKGYVKKKQKSSEPSLKHPKKGFHIPGKGEAVVYTDGGAAQNPGPGGYGAVVLMDGKKNEISGGFKHTTNNRMELMACIEGLSTVPDKYPVTLYSDSKYVVNGITKGWAKKWRSNNWMRTKSERAINPDLWNQLLKLSEKKEIKFVWVKGHAGNPGNERCDELATIAMGKKGLPEDKGYIN